MKLGYWLIGFICLLGAGIGSYYILSPTASGPTVGANENTGVDRNSAQWLAAGEGIYRENCQSCHGVDLQGQPNWQVRKADGRLPAPPHDETGHTWHHPDQVLFAMTKYGPAVMAGQGYVSDMPAYDGVLSDEQIMQVLDYIKSTWPENIQQEQARRTERMEQAS